MAESPTLPSTARQCSPRGGDLQLKLDVARERLTIVGQAAIVMEGTLHVA